MQKGRTVLLLALLASLPLSAQEGTEGEDTLESVDIADEGMLDEEWTEDSVDEGMLDEEWTDIAGSSPEDLWDSTELFLRSPAEGALDEYREDDRFNYGPDGGPEEQGLFEKFVEWLSEFFDRIFGIGETVESVSGVIPYIFFIAALCLVIWTVVRSNGGFRMFRRKAQREGIVFDEEIRDIHALDFPNLLQEALDRKDYRSAVRIHYLQLLQSLSSRGRIDWRPEKTNGEYLAELRSGTLYDPMRRLTLLFDYVWYGEFPIDGGEYQVVRGDFERTAGMIGREGTS